MRIPSLTRQSQPATEDDRRTDLDAPTQVDTRRSEADRASARRAEADREQAERVVVGQRPRSSGLATISLILGVLAVAAVATGVLAAAGVVVGALAVLVGMGGVSATGRPHVAGRSEALFAVVLGLAAVVFGIMALTDTLSWLSADTNQVSRLRDWLYDQMPWLNDL